MQNQDLFLPPVALPEFLPKPLPAPKFEIGQNVVWAHVPSRDFGCIVGAVWATQASTQAVGYHYAVQLDPASPSAAEGITSDWAFEDDLELLPTPQPPLTNE
jgi:hypothetical protein